LLLIFFDYGEIYLLTALIFAAVIWATYKIKLDNVTATSSEKQIKNRTTLFSEFIDGFRYVAHNPVIFYMVGLALLLYIFFTPYQQVYVPLLALNVLDVGRSGAGWLLTFSGIGALAGSLIIASLRQVRRRGLLQICLLLSITGAMVLLAQSRWFPLSALAMFICGGICTAYVSLNTAILMEKSELEYSGRVMSLMSLDRGFVSLGAVMAGGMAELVGPQAGLTIFAAVLFTLTVLMFIVFRRFRNIV
jgi:predicted MFS family arabinose efflux permease